MVSQVILARIALQLRAELKKAAPKRDGRLADSIDVIPTAKGLRIIMVDYGRYVEFGTPPHVIKPKNKKALAFKGEGNQKGKKGMVIVKSVKHPGTRPNPFIRHVINTKLNKIIQKEIAR